MIGRPSDGSAGPDLATAAFLHQSSRKQRLILGLAALTLLLAVIAINAGAANTHPLQVLRALLGLESGLSSVVIWNIRLPRVIAGVCDADLPAQSAGFGELLSIERHQHRHGHCRRLLPGHDSLSGGLCGR